MSLTREQQTLCEYVSEILANRSVFHNDWSKLIMHQVEKHPQLETLNQESGYPFGSAHQCQRVMESRDWIATSPSGMIYLTEHGNAEFNPDPYRYEGAEHVRKSRFRKSVPDDNLHVKHQKREQTVRPGYLF